MLVIKFNLDCYFSFIWGIYTNKKHVFRQEVAIYATMFLTV